MSTLSLSLCEDAAGLTGLPGISLAEALSFWVNWDHSHGVGGVRQKVPQHGAGGST